MAVLGIWLRAFLLAPAATPAVFASSIADNVAVCCSSLGQQFPGQVVYANESAYEDWNHRWADTAELTPWCIFRPLSAADVSFAVKKFGTGAGESADFCPFSIKSGGHTPWPGANDVDTGVALDLRNMNSSVLSVDRSYISIGAGAIWHDVYTRFNGTGVAYPGGRCPGTGVGGVTLGGGYSWFTGEVGFVADSILNFEVVLASGQIVNGNSTSHSDLFRALKGGNNNFGVVTRFDLQVFEHNQMVYGGLVILPASSSDEVLAAFQNFTDDSTGISPSAGLTIEFFLDSPEGDGQILLWLIDTDAEGDHAALQPFLDMKPKLLDRVQTSTIADYTSNIPAVTRVLVADATFVNDLETLKAVNNITLGVFQQYSDIPDLIWDYQLEPLSRHIVQASTAKGGNVMGLEGREDQLIIFIMPLWADATYDADVYEAAETWYNVVKAYTASVDKDVSFEFANYAAPFQKIMASYGPENLQFLKDTSRKYDPSQLFQKAVKGGYKLC